MDFKNFQITTKDFSIKTLFKYTDEYNRAGIGCYFKMSQIDKISLNEYALTVTLNYWKLVMNNVEEAKLQLTGRFPIIVNTIHGILFNDLNDNAVFVLTTILNTIADETIKAVEKKEQTLTGLFQIPDNNSLQSTARLLLEEVLK